jgi:hypothetical protein
MRVSPLANPCLYETMEIEFDVIFICCSNLITRSMCLFDLLYFSLIECDKLDQIDKIVVNRIIFN